MANSHFGTVNRSRVGATPPEWLPFGTAVAELVNTWAGRGKNGSILAFVGKGAGAGHAACFDPSLDEIELNVDECFGEGYEPEMLGDFRDPEVRAEWLAVEGALRHEASHARISTWDLRDCADTVFEGRKTDRLAEFEHELITSFEETRIELDSLDLFPDGRPALRASAMQFVLSGLDEARAEGKDPLDPARGLLSLSRLLLLVCARVDAGVLEKEDAEAVWNGAVAILGEPTVQRLRLIWKAAQRHVDHGRWEPLWALAKDWIGILVEEGHDPAAAPSEDLMKFLIIMVGGKKEDEDESLSLPPGLLKQLAGVVVIRAGEEAAEIEEKAVEAERIRTREVEAAEERAADNAASNVFGRGTFGPTGTKSRSKCVEERPADSNERAAAVKLSRELEKAQYRAKVSTVRPSMLPPGRLRTRGLVAGKAARAQGLIPTAEPFNRRQRTVVDQPPLTVGLMVDISSSMAGVMKQMGSLSWILPESVRRVSGEVGMVYFGNSAFSGISGVIDPSTGERPVRTYSASDGTEAFTEGMLALQGHLGLVGGAGARLLVVVSDLYHGAYEVRSEDSWFTRLVADGCAVVVVAPDEGMKTRCEAKVPAGVQVMKFNETHLGTAGELGRLCVEQLAAAGAHR